MSEAAPEATVVSLESVLPPAPEYDVAPPPKRQEMSQDTADEVERKVARRGRPPKSARTTKDTTPPAKRNEPKKPLQPKDFRPDLQALTDGIWIAGSSLPPAAPYAAVLKANQVGLVDALNAAANQNHTFRNYVEKVSGGGNGTWALQLGMVGIQMGLQALQLMKDKEFRDQLVTANAQALQGYLAQFQTPEAAQAAA